MNTAKSFGKYWAAIQGQQVVALVLIPQIADQALYETYREQSKSSLSLLGDVITGQIQADEKTGQRHFAKHQNHNTRSKNPTGQAVQKFYSLPFYLQ